jgi:hypothetical protein
VAGRLDFFGQKLVIVTDFMGAASRVTLCAAPHLAKLHAALEGKPP